MWYDTAASSAAQASPGLSAYLAARLDLFLAPLLRDLDMLLDVRLVRTFATLVHVIIQFRHNSQGLLLTELGGSLLSPTHAPAGTKRISNLLRSHRWAATIIEHFLWRQADRRITQLTLDNEDALAIWDQSVLEKPESDHSPDLCPVRSSVARRLLRIKPGYFRPPTGRPVFVPGVHWLGLLIVGHGGPPTLAAMRWWTTRGTEATTSRGVERDVLLLCAQAWGQRVLHIWDRGFAGSPWLGEAYLSHVRFVLRWPKRYHILDAQGHSCPAWQVTRGKRSWNHQDLWDVRRRCWRKTGVLAAPVHHPDYPQLPLWLVVARPGQGREPWYLLTTEPADTVAAVWQIVHAYARRWQIEMTWRYSKSELAMESPRLWSWANREKLLLIVSLAYAFLLLLIDPTDAPRRAELLAYWCPRTGKRSRTTPAPLYRLRAALSRLWTAYPPPWAVYAGNSG
jgi:hypothetical protein